MKKPILFFIVLIATFCCKKSGDRVFEEMPEEGNYLLIDNDKYLVDSLSVTYQNSSEGRSYQIFAFNKATDVFLVIQYLLAKTDKDLPVGEFAYNQPADLKTLTANRFHNVIVRYNAIDGKEVFLDGLLGAAIESGMLKIVKDDEGYQLSAISRIAGRSVVLQYKGAIKSEEFSW